MTFQPPASGQANVAEYMISPLPWVSSSTVPSGSVWRIDFPYLTSEIQVHNATPGASTVAVGFTLSGVLGSNRYLVGTNQSAGNTYVGETFSFRSRVKTMYVVGITGSSNVSIFAGLTTVQTRSFPTLTGSADHYSITSSVFNPTFSYDGLG
jgi:hypothetical protein